MHFRQPPHPEFVYRPTHTTIDKHFHCKTKNYPPPPEVFLTFSTAENLRRIKFSLSHNNTMSLALF